MYIPQMNQGGHSMPQPHQQLVDKEYQASQEDHNTEIIIIAWHNER